MDDEELVHKAIWIRQDDGGVTRTWRMKIVNKHIGSDFDDFLREEGILAEVEAAAIKRVIAFQVRL